MATARDRQTATLLSDGRVLIAGGAGDSADLASAELYDAKTATFSPTGSMVVGRWWHTATLLLDGRVLIAGGDKGSVGPTSGELSAELYNPKIGTFSPTGSMTSVREIHTATLLRDGRILVAGGFGGPGALASAEIYTP
jgi:hypothetical protein